MDRRRILGLLRTRRLGRDLRVLESVDSTSEELKRILDRDPCECLVLADGQTAGRGRSGSAWHSPPGVNLHFSFSLSTGRLEDGDIFPLSAALGVGLHRAVSAWTGKSLSIKWPNDLYLEEKKLAGILCEIFRPAGFLVAGIGVNVNAESFPPDIARKATSLFLQEARLFDREEILASVLNETEPVLSESMEKGIGGLIEEYRSRCSLWGRKVRIDGEEGIMKDISPRGGLLLEREGGDIAEIFAGSVEIIGRG
jgi:BirA family biotin operon repressor/biotin-[acetyl-CoA-carboxylase] ligase